MNQSELIKRISIRYKKLTTDEIKLYTKIILTAISKNLAQRNKVVIHEFGSFSMRTRLARVARNPKTGEPISKPQKQIPHFKPSSHLQKQINFETLDIKNIDLGGRPAINDIHPGWMFLRATLSIEAFNHARLNGEKYEFAIEAAISAIKSEFPTMKASPPIIKKILKEFSPEDGEETLRVTKIIDTAHPEFSPSKNTYAIGFGPKPIFPPVNRQKK
ncbi:MAG: integration host factor subunit beta [Bacteroidia bacterium]|nr:integration host factor subunit beta [Methylotenera sp.]